MTSKTLPLSEGQVSYRETGAGEPLVLLHGVGMCAEAWAPQIAGLKGYRVVALDMPGHGASAPLPGRPALTDYVSWAARVIRALGLGPVNVAGHSMGALMATGLAVEHPALVRRMAVLNAVHRRTPEARAAVMARAEALAAGAVDVEAPLARWFSPDEVDLRAKVAGWLHHVSPEGYAAAYRAFAMGDEVYADRWGEILCPALVLTGSGDPNSTPAMAEAMAGAAPFGQLVVIEGHKHMVNLTAPEQVVQAMQDWLCTALPATEGLRA